MGALKWTRRTAAFLVALTVIAVSLSACSSGQADAPIGHTGHEGHPDVAGKPSFVLTDTSGRAFDFSRDTAGRAVLLYFGYTSCPDLCPTEMSAVTAALRQLPESKRGRITVVFVTVDPERDTPAALREWLDIFDPAYIGLVGTPAEVDAAGRMAFGSAWLTPQRFVYSDDPTWTRYAVSHPSVVLGYSPGGQGPFVFTYDTSVADLARDISRMLDKG
jgi:protein SCO1/2